MDKKIPIYFDAKILNSPIQEIQCNESTAIRARVAAFTKYRNRNGSYITDEYADKLIASATRGDTPVIGFFDPETQTWASHTGPTLANAYGYIESFEGWLPLEDSDGVTREYAVFSVVLFTRYYEEAKKIVGQNQSMELDINTIEGDWANFDGIEYFVYTEGDMLGLCVIGSHEPCFSASTFFSKNDDAYKSQYEKFSSLLSELRQQVEGAENKIEGGEPKMNEFENQETVAAEANVEPTTTEVPADSIVLGTVTLNFNTETDATQSAETEAEQVEEPTNEFAQLQEQYAALQTEVENLRTQLTELQEFQSTANAELETLRTENAELQTSISNYENKMKEIENANKEALIEKYEKNLEDSEEFSEIKNSISDYTYEGLEGKLAIMFANQQLNKIENEAVVPLVHPTEAETEFALFMKNYKKN